MKLHTRYLVDDFTNAGADNHQIMYSRTNIYMSTSSELARFVRQSDVGQAVNYTLTLDFTLAR